MRIWMSGIIGMVACVGFSGVANSADAVKAGTTLDNLQTAYNGESNAKARYEAFAAKADEEGYKSVVALFKAAAAAEGIHATKHAAAIKQLGAEPKATIEKSDVKSTKENLETALKGENAEKSTMYPAFVTQAVVDKNVAAEMSFKGAMAAEVEHAKLFKKAAKELDSWKAPGKVFIVCQVCGFTTMDLKLKKCPVCDTPRSKFDAFK